MPLPTIHDVQTISAIADPVARNRQITLCYHQLSAAVATRTGGSANWCTFATWASRQAGETIRGNDLENKLRQTINDDAVMTMLGATVEVASQMGVAIPIHELQQSVLGKTVHRCLVHSADAVARGNKKVFEEIGYEFARFVAQCLNDQAFSQEKIENFRSGLRSGDPPDGQEYLKKAFSRYYESFYEANKKRAAELRFLANIEIGFHEQTRLQPEIAEALRAGEIQPDLLLESVTGLLAKRARFWTRLLFSVKMLIGSSSLLKHKVDGLASILSLKRRQVMTAQLMTLTLPHNRCLRLGSDLQLTPCAILASPAHKELLAMLANVDPTPGSTADTGATDWANLNERMHYIADLFRCCHEDQLLFEAVY